jgi:AbrB family looped-hinge helix DNA binding protein
MHGEITVEASTTKVSSKGQIVIPVNIRRAAGLKKGETILAIAINDTVVLKKITNKTFEETMKPIWAETRKLGLTEENVDALIEEAKTKNCSS